jgi:poly(3-hydroxybutyrate) depolymerase
MQAGIGHYGVFNGSRFRSEIAPRISKFMIAHTRKDTIVKRAVRAVRKS